MLVAKEVKKLDCRLCEIPDLADIYSTPIRDKKWDSLLRFFRFCELVGEEGFTRSISESELPPGKMKTVEVNGEGVLLANVDGKLYGIGAYCNHEMWDLSEGALEGLEVICAGHGTIWNLKTGRGKFKEPVKDEPLYDVKAEDGYIYVKKI
jgi:3-phenylpropionate/trans-cinnamate dioxygenase ferredoxin subunit